MLSTHQKLIEQTPAYLAGQDAQRAGIPLQKSAIKNLRFGSDRHEQFIAGYDSKPVKK